MKIFVPAAIAACVLAAPAAAATLGFETLGGVADTLFPSPLVVGDYQFTGNFVGNDYVVNGSSESDFAGSFALKPFNGETHTLRRVDGAAFDLLSLDFAENDPDIGSGSLDFIGALASGGSVLQTLTSDGVFGFQSAAFTGFENLSAVSFSIGAGVFDQQFQLDNIELALTAPIPLPASLPLLLAALGGLGYAARRSRGR